MEHHTYAKSGSKKWSAEEKRLLVTKRIEAEDLFSKYSSKQAEPWKKFKNMAKIGDYSERALRKQWLNMVQRYRIQKSTLQVTPLNKQCIDVLNEEWEYFGEIHAYMTQRTTDLHSYALKEPNQDQSHNNNNNNNNSLAMRGVVNDHNFCDRSAGIKAEIRTHQLTMDKSSDSFSDKLVDSLAKLDEQQYKLEESSSSSSGKEIKNEPIKHEFLSDMDLNECTAYTFTDSDSQESSEPSDPVAVEESELSSDSIVCSPPLPEISEAKTIVQLPACSETASETPKPQTPKRKRKVMSEREKYYRHRRRYDHRMEVRLGGLCIVAGQLLEHLVPDLNVAPLLMNVYNNVDFNCNSSCDEEDTEDDDGQ
ncbi:uncharacterized protein LOC117779934 isoform X2 [Drosophila innubila]|uniref:uncharacterized protein LOC117779934 isoform X2 n=1 Tax=Drosophila innubila TaxID=198719 RepID=UPI00148E35F5|nr:uncharacterized protein LOC117779934 isoform X2 [Drosophila innubila]